MYLAYLRAVVFLYDMPHAVSREVVAFRATSVLDADSYAGEGPRGLSVGLGTMIARLPSDRTIANSQVYASASGSAAPAALVSKAPRLVHAGPQLSPDSAKPWGEG